MPKSIQIVVDTSVIIKWLNYKDEDHLKQAQILLDHIEMGKVVAIVPELVKYEVGNALLKGKRLKSPEIEDALDAFSKLPFHVISPSFDELSDIYEIASILNTTFYDATFIGLAKIYNATLVTANPKHQKHFPGINVIPLKDYGRKRTRS